MTGPRSYAKSVNISHGSRYESTTNQTDRSRRHSAQTHRPCAGRGIVTPGHMDRGGQMAQWCQGNRENLGADQGGLDCPICL
jgi:hypothetical protein